MSVIVPCLNEREHIIPLLESLVRQDYPGRLEVLIADGGSKDGTAELLGRWQEQGLLAITVLANPSGTVPAGLNLALRAATGSIIMRMDVHADYPRDYVTALATALQTFQADNVGVVIKTVPGNDSTQARAVAFCLSHAFGVGGSRFRTGVTKPVEADTVPFGCWPRQVFERIGTFDEDLVRNQDDEFNGRMRRHGMRLVLLPGPLCTYKARPTVGKCARMLYQYGLFKPLVARKLGSPATLRQLLPPALVATLAGGVLLSPLLPAAGMAAALAASAHLVAGCSIALRELVRPRTGSRAWSLLLPAVFLTNHLAYGLGYWRGLLSLCVPAFRAKTVPLSR